MKKDNKVLITNIISVILFIFIIVIFSFSILHYKNNIKCDVFNENDYYLGLVRGCDLGCIDYDLRLHNITWNITQEEYNILNSNGYRKCSEYCLNHFIR